MVKKNKWILIITTLALLLPMILGLLLWNRLPKSVPTHWGIDGQPDGWSSKAVAVFLFPAIMLAFHWVCILVSTADPKRANYSQKTFQLVLWICPMLSLLINSLSYAAALGKAIRVEILMPILMGILFVVIGNLLPKMKQSYTMGIKLPWTLNNEENWNKTHRLGGWVWVIGGIVMIATAFLGQFWLLLGLVVLMCLIPTVYSYCLHRKQQTDSKGEDV